MPRSPLALAPLAALLLPALVAASGADPDPSGGDFCSRVGAKLSSISVEECRSSGLEPTGGKSVEGVDLMVFESLPKLRRTGGEPDWLVDLLALGPVDPKRVLFVGGCHGDEFATTTLLFKWIAKLQGRYDNELHLRIVPLMNPDGMLRSRGTRPNANGVDLNRNMPTRRWDTEAMDAWHRRASSSPRRFPGRRPASEPETRWLLDEIDTFAPEVIVSLHAPYNAVDFDGPPKPPGDLGPLRLRLLGTFPGSLGRYAGEERRIPVVTIELPSAGIMPPAAEQQALLDDLLRYLDEKVDAERRARNDE
ncbi:MAG: M14 family zinc carboxypeptidase [Acidobacteriota bacterium]